LNQKSDKNGLNPNKLDIPYKPIRTLREYTRYHSKLVSCKSSGKNRFQIYPWHRLSLNKVKFFETYVGL